MPIHPQEIVWGLGFHEQADLGTGYATPANYWRQTFLNRQPFNVLPVVEDDTAETGKGHEFATAIFKSHRNSTPRELEDYPSSEMLAWCGHFGLGSSIAGAGSYTAVPFDPVADGRELPTFPVVQQIRAAAGGLDQMLPGCVLNGFRLEIGSGPGRSASRLFAEVIPSGRIVEPSGVTLPADALEPHFLLAASLELTALGTNYVTARRINQANLAYSNNLNEDRRFFPGSSVEDGFAVAGRAEAGGRSVSLGLNVDFEVGSTELTKLRDLTTGTIVLSLTNSAAESVAITIHKAGFADADWTENGDILNLQLDTRLLYDSTNGLLTMVSTTALAGIGSAA